MADLHETQRLAFSLLDEHGLSDWMFQYDNAKRRFGQCRYGTKTITMSAELTELNDDEQVLNTLLHEIAHAKAGPRHGHDSTWRSIAVQLGCDGERCYDNEAVETPEGAWVGTCPLCGYHITMHRKPKRRKACRFCCELINLGAFCTEAEYTWERAS